MGIHADFFVATLDDAVQYDNPPDSDETIEDRYEIMRSQGLTSLELETLWAITDQREWSPETGTLEPIGEPGDQWLFRFPDAVVLRLSSLTQKDLSRCAQEWAKTEELSCQAEEIEPVIAGLVDLAKKARASGRGMFLWGSL